MSSLPQLSSSSRGCIRGVGIGLRRPHYLDWLKGGDPDVDWLEIVPENFAGRGGLADRVLGSVCERWPVVAHGVSLDIGGTSTWTRERLASLRSIVDRVNPPFFTEHLCWSIAGPRSTYDLVPLPFRSDVARHTATRVRALADALERPIALENITYYAAMPGGLLDEAEFVTEVLERADAGLLLDVNNAYCNAKNHGLDPWEVVSRLPLERVVQLHIAGHSMDGTRWFDNHGAPIADPVLALYGEVIERLGDVPTLLEWDTHIPPLERVLEERRRVAGARVSALERRAADLQRRDLAAATQGTSGRPLEIRSMELPQSRPQGSEEELSADHRAWIDSFFAAAEDWVARRAPDEKPKHDFADGGVPFYATLFLRNYDKILRELHAEVHQACRRLGIVSWRELVEAHSAREPCTSPDPNLFGATFEQTIQALHPQVPWLAELADYAWVRHRVWCAPDGEDPGLESRVFVRHYTTDVQSLARALLAVDAAFEPARLEPRPTTLLIYRHRVDLTVRVRDVGPGEVLALMRRAGVAPARLPLATSVVDGADERLVAWGCFSPRPIELAP